MNQQFSDEELIQALKHLKEKVKPSLYFKVTTKERLLNLLEEKGQHASLRRTMKKWIAGFAMVTLLFFIAIPFSFNWNGYAYIGEAKVLSGELKITRQHKDSTTSSSSRLQVGDVLSIGEKSRVEVHFIDDSWSTFSSGTIVTIDNFLINSHNIENSIVALNLQQGEMAAMVNKHDGDLARMQVQTPTGLIEAKSSDFTVKVGHAGETEVAASKNSVKVKAFAKSDTPSSSKKIVAEAQALEGYKVNIAMTSSQDITPLRISSTETPAPVNTDKEESNSNSAPTAENPTADTNQNTNAESTMQAQKVITGQLEIAQVKLYQAVQFLNDQKQEDAFTLLKEYRTHLLQTYNLLASEQRTENFADKDITTILLSSLSKDIQSKLSLVSDPELRQQVAASLNNLLTIENSLKEKLALSSVTVYTPTNATGGLENTNQNGRIDTAQENTNANVTVPVSENTNENVSAGMNGQSAFEIQNVKSLIILQTTLTPEKQQELEPLIAEHIAHVASYLNQITDWRQQQSETQVLVNLFPNEKLYQGALLELRTLLSDRISYIVTSKLKRLR